MAGYIGKAKSLAVLAEQDPTVPSQTGNSGKYLTTDGTTASWGTIASDAITEGNSSVEVVDAGTGYVSTTVDDTEITRATPTGLGVRTSSPDSKLTVANVNSWHDGVQIRRDNPGDQYLALGYDIGVAYIAAVDESPAAEGDGQTISFGRSSDGSTFTEHMRIESTGRITWGSTSETRGTCEFYNYGSSSFDIRRYADPGNVMIFRDDTTVSGTISVSGSSCSYSTSSDYRLKENVVDMTGAITRVKALAPKRFNWIADATDTVVDGFIAHEAQSVVPEAVTGTQDEVDAEGNPEYQGIDQSKLVPLLTGALQEAIAKIETLETTVADLQTRVTALEGA